jgi:hypothetical protein
VTWSYDELYRLKQETIAGSSEPNTSGTIGFVYDSVGNRRQRTSTIPAVPPATYDTTPTTLLSDTYDAQRQHDRADGNTYTYDLENR